MIITSIELNNFFSHRQTALVLQPGVNVITGHNGSGKSSLAHAIGFALFGRPPGGYRNMQDAIFYGQKEATVRIGLRTAAGEEYFVLRVFGAQSRHEIHNVSGQVVRSKTDNTMAYLAELMDLPATTDLAQVYTQAVALRQEEFKAPFFLTPTDRKRVFETVLGLDEFERMWQTLLDPLRQMAQTSDKLKAQISEAQGRLATLKVSESRLDSYEETIAAARQDLADLQGPLAEVRARCAQLEPDQEGLGRLNRKASASQLLLDKGTQTLKKIAVQTEQFRKEKCPVCGQALTSASLPGHFQTLSQDLQKLEQELCLVLGKPVTAQLSPATDYETMVDHQTRLNMYLAMLGGQVTILAEELQEANRGGTDWRSAMAEEKDLALEEARLSQLLISAEQGKASEEQILDIAESQVRQMGEDAERLEIYQSGQQYLTAFRDLIRSVGPVISRRLIQEIGQQADTIFGQIMSDRYASAELEWLPDYDLLAHLDGRPIPFHRLSGGQQTPAAIALRLALMFYLAGNIGFIILDEPMLSLDREGIQDSLARGIVLALRNQTQTLVISHTDAFDRLAVNHIRLALDTESGASVVTNTGR